MACKTTLLTLVFCSALAVAIAGNTGVDTGRRALLKAGYSGPPQCETSAPAPYGSGSTRDFCRCCSKAGYKPDAIVQICLKLGIDVDLDDVLDLLEGLLDGLLGRRLQGAGYSGPPECETSAPAPYGRGSTRDFCRCCSKAGYKPDAIVQICLKLGIDIDLDGVLDLLEGLLGGLLGRRLQGADYPGPPQCQKAAPAPYGSGNTKDFCRCCRKAGYDPEAILQICLKLGIDIDLDGVLGLLDGLLGGLLG